MRDPFEELGALAHEATSAPVEPKVHARGRQQLIEAASKLQTSRRIWSKPLVATVLAAAAALALTWGSLSLLRSRPMLGTRPAAPKPACPKIGDGIARGINCVWKCSKQTDLCCRTVGLRATTNWAAFTGFAAACRRAANGTCWRFLRTS